MRYVMSDVHGEAKLFFAMLKRISFSDRDELFICGDLIDKGNGSVAIVKYAQTHPNVHCIKGNHEDAFLKHYRFLMENASPDQFHSVLDKLREWFSDDETLEWEMLDWLEALPYSIETEDFICVHAGIPVLSNGELMPLSDVSEEYLIHDRSFKEPNVLHNSLKCVFFGHTTTDCVSGQARVIAYPRTGVSSPKCIRDFCKIHVDTGAWSNGVLACVCVDTCKTFYVKKSTSERKYLK